MLVYAGEFPRRLADALQVGGGFVPIALGVPGDTAVGAGEHELRIEFKSCGEVGDGFVVGAVVHPGHAATVADRSVFRVRFEDSAEVGYRLVGLADEI